MYRIRMPLLTLYAAADAFISIPEKDSKRKTEPSS